MARGDLEEMSLITCLQRRSCRELLRDQPREKLQGRYLGLRIDLVPGTFWTFVRATGLSRNANSNCIVALLFGGRLLSRLSRASVTARALSKSLTVQRFSEASGLSLMGDTSRHLDRHPIRPPGRNQRAAPVRQNHEQLGNAPPRQAPDDRKPAPFKRMPFTCDDGRNLNVSVMGNLSWLRSTA